MGLTIKGKFDGSPSYDMGYLSFYCLRRDIAYTVSEEYGKHYESITKWIDDVLELLNKEAL